VGVVWCIGFFGVCFLVCLCFLFKTKKWLKASRCSFSLLTPELHKLHGVLPLAQVLPHLRLDEICQSLCYLSLDTSQKAFISDVKG